MPHFRQLKRLASGDTYIETRGDDLLGQKVLPSTGTMQSPLGGSLFCFLGLHSDNTDKYCLHVGLTTTHHPSLGMPLNQDVNFSNLMSNIKKKNIDA